MECKRDRKRATREKKQKKARSQRAIRANPTDLPTPHTQKISHSDNSHAENFSFQMPFLKITKKSTYRKTRKRKEKRVCSFPTSETEITEKMVQDFKTKISNETFFDGNQTLWLKSCQRHAKSSSSYSFLQLEIILVFRCHRLKSALLQLVGGEMHIFRFKFHSLGTQRCHSYHFVRKGFCTQQQGDFMPKPLKRFRHTCNFLISSYP